MQARLQRFGTELRPGAMLGLIVAAIVGLTGLVQFDQRLMLIGLVALPLILALNAVIVGVRQSHLQNTRPGAAYLSAEEMIRLQQGETSKRLTPRR